MKVKIIRTIHPSGYPVDFEVEAGEKLGPLIAQLNRWGYRPGIAGDTWPRTPEGVPICPKHQEVMSKREKQGDSWYSHKVVAPATGEVSYCRGYPSPSGRGWYVNRATATNDPADDEDDLPPIKSPQPPPPRPPAPRHHARPPRPRASNERTQAKAQADAVLAQVNEELFGR